MPSPRTKPQPLSDSEIQQIAAEIKGGRPPMVWFTAAAVGVAEGRSGKVVALGDPSIEDFLEVRPTGSKDVLSFSPAEVTLTKPPRGATPATPKSATTPKPVATLEPEYVPTTPKEMPVTQPSATRTASATPAPAKTVAKQQGSPNGEATKPEAAPAAKKTAARKTKTPEVTVTLTGTADGEWTVDVVNGKKRTVRGLAVASSAVAQAAKTLHPEVADVVAGVLDAARDVQEAKVQALQAELEQARRLLEDLTD
ncbi:DUF6319 family protein [Nocardia callitridis]|uniref:Cell wall anchor protein n=1 Tax=Nocardia callitridis TaxID=648753 RepID=A0ABP9L722_9NOCA